MTVKNPFRIGSIRRFAWAGAPLLVVLIFVGSRVLPLDAADADKPAAADIEIVQASEVKWTPLNPARGDKGPQAGTLWGNRAGREGTGFLVKFVDGFSSPPHIHNVTYRGVVISGLVHNDDPEAEKIWMPKGSFWTQPAGEVHITAAKGDENVAFIEIESGPYLVLPSEDASDNGERPINVHPSNLVWLDSAHTTWIADSATAQIAFLWGKPENGETNGTFLKLPAGFDGQIRSDASVFRLVVIEGEVNTGKPEAKTLEPGSYLRSDGPSTIRLTNEEDVPGVVYIRAEGVYQVID
ncbi:MAG: DUF4437 domain-containing protein [Verrucomicrobiota bacterium]